MTLLDFASQEPITWVFTGDSITHGLRHTQNERSYVEHFEEAWRGETGRYRDFMTTTAISGNTIANINADFEHRVARWQPTVISLMIGTNDCSTGPQFPFITAEEFGAQVEEFVDRVNSLGAALIIQTPPPVDPAHAPERARLDEFVSELRRVATERTVLLVDHHQAFRDIARTTGAALPWLLMSDPFHPGAAGHAFMAWTLVRTLGVEALVPRSMKDFAARASAAFPHEAEVLAG